MDIAKYIGLFLLKNNFCYIHGLGNLELKKKPAVYDGEALQAPSYEVLLTPGGSIDDNLANFIATAEQISISKAANELRDYSTQAKADLNAGKEVTIPSLGRFVIEDGTIVFITDEGLQKTPAPIPVVKVARTIIEEPATPPQAEPVTIATPKHVTEPVPELEPEPAPRRRRLFRGETKQQVPEPFAESIPQPEEQPQVQEQAQSQFIDRQELPAADYPPYPESEGGIHWGRVFLILIVIAIVIAGAIWGIQYINMQETPPSVILPQDTAIASHVTSPADVQDTNMLLPTQDTATTPGMAQPATVTPMSAAPESNEGKQKFTFVIFSAGMREVAENKMVLQHELGRNASVVRDSKGYHVLQDIMCSPEDTLRIADSLRKAHNPTGRVYIHHPEVQTQ